MEFERPEWLEQMAGILETLNEGVIIVDDCDHVIFVNACFEEMTGISRDDILGQDPLLVYYGPEDIAFIRERRREVRALGRTRHEFFLPTKDGTRLPVISSSRSMEDPDGRTFTIVSFTDISEQKNAEDQLRAANKLLEERQRYSVAARKSVLERSWPAICDQLLDHYEAVLSPIARARMARRQHAQGE